MINFIKRMFGKRVPVVAEKTAEQKLTDFRDLYVSHDAIADTLKDKIAQAKRNKKRYSHLEAQLRDHMTAKLLKADGFK